MLKTEISEKGCSICIEDQKKVILSNGLSFLICKKYASLLKSVLETIISEGFIIDDVQGYIPQMSKGPLDSQGNRTVFSNHSFGVAIDINRMSNGLYDNCLEWNNDCKLIVGGTYDLKNKRSIIKSSSLVHIMKQIGFKWGGEIKGKQKDFMHFSRTGY